MITEQDIRAIYEGLYKFAEEIGDSGYTNNLAYQMYHLLTNTPSDLSGSIRNTTGLVAKLDREYQERFKGLSKKQKLGVKK
jgi:hypothetical protein